jgi:hypothetical protein
VTPDRYVWNALSTDNNAKAVAASKSRVAMIETVLIQRMLAVVPFEAYCRCLARTISDLIRCGNVAGRVKFRVHVSAARRPSSSRTVSHAKLAILSVPAVAASAFGGANLPGRG